jgi:hypothetical protein
VIGWRRRINVLGRRRRRREREGGDESSVDTSACGGASKHSDVVLRRRADGQSSCSSSRRRHWRRRRLERWLRLGLEEDSPSGVCVASLRWRVLGLFSLLVSNRLGERLLRRT